MTPEERDMLEKTFALSQENNQILKKMQKSGRTGRVLQYFYWAFIVFGSVAAVYLGQLYVNSIQSATDISNGITSVATTTGAGLITNLNNLKSELQQITQ